jgi:serine/threonine protein kinase
MVLGTGYNKKIDLWALGVYLYELSNYAIPFSPKQITKTAFEATVKQA